MSLHRYDPRCDVSVEADRARAVNAFPFERSGDLMTVTARVWGAHGDRELLLVIDTGAAATSIEPAILDELGYSSPVIMRTRVPRPANYSKDTWSGSRFYALGADLSSFVVRRSRLPTNMAW